MKKLALFLSIVLMLSVFPMFTFAAEVSAPVVTDPEAVVWSDAQNIASCADAAATDGGQGMASFQVAYDADNLYVRVTLSKPHTAIYIFINGESVVWYGAKVNSTNDGYEQYVDDAITPFEAIDSWTTEPDEETGSFYYVVDMTIAAPGLEAGDTLSLDVHLANWGTQGSGVWAWSSESLYLSKPTSYGTVTLAAAETPVDPDPVDPAPGEGEEEDDTTAEVPVVGGTSQNVTASTVYEAPVYGAEITWGALTFEYTKSTNTWAPTATDADKITVENTTEDGVAIDVAFSYAKAEAYTNIEGTFTGVNTDTPNRIGQGEDVTATLVLSGTLPRGTTNAVIGSVTVTLTAVPEA